jgi:hypothetical protein
MALLDLWWEVYRKLQNFGNKIPEIITQRHISYINHRIARRAGYIQGKLPYGVPVKTRGLKTQPGAGANSPRVI